MTIKANPSQELQANVKYSKYFLIATGEINRILDEREPSRPRRMHWFTDYRIAMTLYRVLKKLEKVMDKVHSQRGKEAVLLAAKFVHGLYGKWRWIECQIEHKPKPVFGTDFK